MGRSREASKGRSRRRLFAIGAGLGALLIVALLAAGLVVASDHGSLSVEIVETNDPVTEGETLEVSVLVENAENESTTEEVTLAFDGEAVDSTTVTVDAEASETVTLEYETSEGDAGDNPVTVSSENDADSTTVTVEEPEPAHFRIIELVTYDPVEAGDTLEVTTTIANHGDETATKTVEFKYVWDAVDTAEITLEPGEERTLEFSQQTSSDEVGEQDVWISTEDDTEHTTVTVTEAASTSFSVTTFDVPDEVEPGEEIEATATIENLGDESGTTTVEYRFDGETVYATDLSLDASEAVTETITYTVPSDLSSGTYQHGVYADDSLTAPITVGEAEPPSWTQYASSGDSSNQASIFGSNETPDETETPEPTETPDETETPEPTETPDETETPESTETPDETETPESTDEADETSTGDEQAAATTEQPGFGVVVALLAVLGAVVVAARRR